MHFASFVKHSQLNSMEMNLNGMKRITLTYICRMQWLRKMKILPKACLLLMKKIFINGFERKVVTAERRKKLQSFKVN